MSGTILSDLYTYSRLIPMKSRWNSYHYYLYFTNEETEAQGIESFVDHTYSKTNMWQSGDFNLYRLTLGEQLGLLDRKGGGEADNFIWAFPLLAVTLGEYVNLLSLSVDICNVKIEILHSLLRVVNINMHVKYMVWLKILNKCHFSPSFTQVVLFY